MKTSFGIFFLGFLSFLPRHASADEPTVLFRSEISPKEIYVGDPVHCRITVTFSTALAAVPVTSTAPLGEFELLSASSSVSIPSVPGRLSVTHDLFFTTFSTGPLTLPAFPIYFSAPNGTTVQAMTNPVLITVKSLLAEKGDEGGLRPLKGPFNVRSWAWVWWLLGAIVVIGAGILGWSNRKKSDGTGAAPAGPPRPPEEIAWEALHALEDADLIAQNQVKEFYFRLSQIFRAYLENRYGFSALDRTTAELVGEFRKAGFSQVSSNLARDFLDGSDLVKFAKFTPPPEDIVSDLNRVKQFLTQTTPERKETPRVEQAPV